MSGGHQVMNRPARRFFSRKLLLADLGKAAHVVCPQAPSLDKAHGKTAAIAAGLIDKADIITPRGTDWLEAHEETMTALQGPARGVAAE
jgi:hypothetical protein